MNTLSLVSLRMRVARTIESWLNGRRGPGHSDRRLSGRPALRPALIFPVPHAFAHAGMGAARPATVDIAQSGPLSAAPVNTAMRRWR